MSTTQEDASQAKMTKKEKKKQSRGKRLFNFFRGPETQPLPILSDTSALKLKESLEKPSESMEMSGDVLLKSFKEEMIVGLNSVIRSVEKRSVLGVILTDPLTVHVQKSLFDLCSDAKVPLLLLPGLSDLRSHFRLSNLTVMAFKPIVSQPTATFHGPYRVFSELALSFQSNKFNDDQKEEEVEEKEPEVVHDKWPKLHFPQLENFNFFIPKKESREKSYETISLKNVDDVVSQTDFITFSNESRRHFPNREVELNLSLTVESDEETDSKFIHSLLSEGTPRKRSKVSDKKSGEKFKEPQTVQLAASGKNKGNPRKKKRAANKAKKRKVNQ